MFHPIRIIKSFRFALEGIYLGLKVDHNLKLHFIVAIIVMILAFFLKVNAYEFLFILLGIAFVIFAELINTAVEELTNLVVQEHRKEAKIAKDVSAAAVLFAAFFALMVGIVILLPKIVVLFS
jgi:diacylglycerol kinase (ATP)